MGSCRLLLALILVSSLQAFVVTSTEFAVGGEDGWRVRKPNEDRDVYNEWASKNRFKVDDTIRKLLEQIIYDDPLCVISVYEE